MKRLAVVAICLAIAGCGGSSHSAPKGPPVMYDLTSTPIGGNADPKALNSESFLQTELFYEYAVPEAEVLVFAFFSGSDPSQVRRLNANLPIEAVLLQGSEFDIGSSDPVKLFLNDNSQVFFPNNSWGPFNGSATVESRSGRVVTLRIDAIGERQNEATGQIRIQGTITLDFSQQIEPPGP